MAEPIPIFDLHSIDIQILNRALSAKVGYREHGTAGLDTVILTSRIMMVVTAQ
jgi:hypothetical protein